MSPQIQAILAALAVMCFLMAVVGFLTIVWKMSWSVARFASAQEKYAEGQRDLVNAIAGSIKEFVSSQREANERNEGRLALLEERQDQQSHTMRAFSRKVATAIASEDDAEKENIPGA